MTDEKYGYRNDRGLILKFSKLSDAIAYQKIRGNGTVCRLQNGRWYTINAFKMKRRAQEITAQHMLSRAIKLGYSTSGTNMIIPGSEMYGSYWWPIVRDCVLDRDGRRCQLCGSDGAITITNAHGTYEDYVVQVHHIMPRHCGGSDHPVNLITLCTVCHKMIHKNRENESLAFHKAQTRLEVF